jgi:TrmH family RNA methyltransferase
MGKMQSKEILSLQHPLVKHLVKLRQSRDYRYECQRVVISGIKLVKELSSHYPLCTLVLEQGTTCSAPSDQVCYVTPQILKKITGLENPEPIAAEIAMPPPSDLSKANFLLILDGISDPGNLGTLLRTARALGWEGAFLTSKSTDPFNEKALRAAQGASFTLPWKSGTWEELSALLHHKKMLLFAADTSGMDLALCKTSHASKAHCIALALGNETHGLSSALKQRSTLVAIPMQGGMESLNVATAGAILMYELKSCQ